MCWSGKWYVYFSHVWKTNKQTNKPTNKHTDTQTNKPTNKQKQNKYCEGKLLASHDSMYLNNFLSVVRLDQECEAFAGREWRRII